MTDPIWSPGPARRQTANIRRFIDLVQSELDPGIKDYWDLYHYSLEQPGPFWRAVWDFCALVGNPGAVPLEHDCREKVRPGTGREAGLGHAGGTSPRMGEGRTMQEQLSRATQGAVAEASDLQPNDLQTVRWFPQAQLNFAENLLRFRDEQPAIIFRSETGPGCELSYAELYQAVAHTAAALIARGVGVGDRVAGFMPNVPETVIAMLATTSIGAVWSSCSPDFGVAGVVDRFGQIEPKVLFCAAGYSYGGKVHDCMEKISGITSDVRSIEHVVVVPYMNPQANLTLVPQAVWFADFADTTAKEITFERLPFNHPVYILFSSGTTGVPKCIVHGAGGTLLQHMKELVLHTNVRRSDRICYFTTCGWMMWNWLVSNLATGACVVLFDGSPFYPGPAAMFDLVDELDISVLGTGAKAISAWEKSGIKPRESHQLKSLVTLLSTGSPLAPEGFDFVYRDIKTNLCLASISGGTDIVSCFILGCPILPVNRGELQCPGLGMAVEIRRDDGSLADIDETGELCCSKAFPSMPVFFWGDADGSKYRSAYFEKFPGTWSHGDFAKKTANLGYIIQGRSDATLNPGGVRIGTAEIYRQVEKLDQVLESICVGQDWDNDVRVVLFVKLREGFHLDGALQNEIRKLIRQNTTPRHVPAKIIQVSDIPRTISGKIVELAVRNVIHGRPVSNQDALANPQALELYRDLPQLGSE